MLEACGYCLKSSSHSSITSFAGWRKDNSSSSKTVYMHICVWVCLHVYGGGWQKMGRERPKIYTYNLEYSMYLMKWTLVQESLCHKKCISFKVPQGSLLILLQQPDASCPLEMVTTSLFHFSAWDFQLNFFNGKCCVLSAFCVCLFSYLGFCNFYLFLTRVAFIQECSSLCLWLSDA